MAPSGWDCHVHVFDAAAPVLPGHYRPIARPLEEIEALAAAQGCGQLVLVQPSVYGSDPAVLLEALGHSPGRHRGVVVLSGSESEAQLDTYEAAGVRGVRFNLVSPVGSARVAALHQLQEFAPRLRARRWHVQWYAGARELPLMAQCQQVCSLPFVLDHLAGLTCAADEAAWRALQQLADGGAWIKLSGWYRLQAEAPYDTLLPLIRRVAALFGERMVWGSDWPHTSFAPPALPAYASLWRPVVEALGEAAARRVRLAGAGLYG